MSGGKKEAAALVWRWKDGDDMPKRAAAARRGAVVRSIVGAVAAGVLVWLGRPIAAGAVGGVSALVLILGLASPLGAYAAITRALDRLAAWVGRAVAWLLLAPFFYVVITPFGLLARRGKSDKLGRRYDRGAKTYWARRDRQLPIDRPY
ncbi:MAG: hypothetical protein IT378_20940 [Sandaracinaceae bacterium]|nr:hypothetical protein [Sandaracinaceae bacterium]